MYVYRFAILLPLLALSACVDPVVPAYDYTTGFVLVEGTISAGDDNSEVHLQRSTLSFGSYRLDPIPEARVHCVAGDGSEMEWSPGSLAGSFRPPAAFVARPGDTYFLRIALATGEMIESQPETLPAPGQFDNLRVSFDQEAYYSDSRDRFVPAFTLLVDTEDTDPADNFYRYTHRTWSQTSICYTCRNSVYRNGRCVETPSSRLVDRYDYTCSDPCWVITEGTSFRLGSDDLNPNATTDALPVARIDFTGSGKLLAEVRQHAITRRAFQYYEVLQNLTEGSSGLNAPLPAPLYGNLRDLSDLETTVLGYVGGSSVVSRRLVWNRDSIDGEPLSRPPQPVLEPVSPAPPSAPCDGPNRTTEEPAGWNS